MNNTSLYTAEELEMFKNFENGNYSSISNDKLLENKKILKKVADNTIKQKMTKKSLNIRLFEDDLIKIKAIALHEGLPYQTFLSSMVHKIATGKISV